MPSVNISMYQSNDTPRVEILTLDDGHSFLSVQFGDSVSVFLPGLDDVTAAHARALGKALIDAADNMPPCLKPDEPERELTGEEAAPAFGTFVAGKGGAS